MGYPIHSSRALRSGRTSARSGPDTGNQDRGTKTFHHRSRPPHLRTILLPARKYAQAESLLQEVLNIREPALGVKHPDVASTINTLADVYVAQGQYSLAEALYKQALEAREEVLGLEHPDVAETISGMANLSFKQTKYQQAEQYYKQALAIREKVFGGEHPDVDFIAVGHKGRDFVVRSPFNLLAEFTNYGEHPGLNDASAIAQVAVEAFIKGEVDVVYLVYAKFVNTVTQTPTVVKLPAITSEPPSGDTAIALTWLSSTGTVNGLTAPVVASTAARRGRDCPFTVVNTPPTYTVDPLTATLVV